MQDNPQKRKYFLRHYNQVSRKAPYRYILHEQRNQQDDYQQTHSVWSLRINAISMLLSAITVLVAFIVFYETRKQTEAAIKSANASVVSAAYTDSVFQATKAFNRNSLESSKKADILDSMSVSAQIASLKEAQRQFNATNTAYIELGIIIPFQVGNKTKIEYMISNLKNTPVKIIRSINSPMISPTVPEFSTKYIRRLKGSNMINSYLEKGLPLNGSFTLPLSDEEVRLLKMRQRKLYLSGHIVYLDLLVNREKAYVYFIELEIVSESYVHVRMLHGENRYIN